MTTQDDGETVYIHEHDLKPDNDLETLPTAILEQDEETPTRGVLLQTIAFALGIFLLILLIWTLASQGRINLFQSVNGSQRQANQPLQARLASYSNGANASGITQQGLIVPLGTFPDGTPRPAIDPLFADYWQQHGGVRVFGLPESTLLEKDGRRFQWFERARLEFWPENDPPYEIQPGRLGVEFTDGRDFPTQEFFVNRPGLRYVKVTEHGIADPFLSFWEQNGGIDIFGYPISEQVQEILPEDGAIHQVQYFERARLEWHPNDTAQPIKIGLLGTNLYRLNSKPNIIEPAQPTPVPLLGN